MSWSYLMDWRDYDPGLPPTLRFACRAVLWRGDELQMVYSAKYRYYKFPGGGMKPGESWEEALAREVREETGLRLMPRSAVLLGETWERRRDLEGENPFQQYSRYYLCELEEGGAGQDLDDYEREAEFEPRLVSPWEALSQNECGGPLYLEREILVLRRLLRERTLRGGEA